ncbi:MAG: hypothetical protein E3J87_00450 [Candidatus Cloacimonadota bacterium]|nr:MAG: hypothetical protein E3J87_00450 [Candidatus Cloacimonadota bacterium]
MKNLILIISILLIPVILFSGWEVQREPSPHQVHFQGIDFVDSLHGWVVGGRYHMTPVYYGGYTGRPWTFQRGVIGKTPDGGASWGITEIDSSICFYDVQFLDTLRGWVVGNSRYGSDWYGLILKTQDGGDTWEKDSFPVNSNKSFVAVDFVDTLNGWVTGDTKLLHTIDGGINWEIIPFSYGGDLEFVSPSEGWGIVIGVIYHTTDAGTTWSFQFNPSSMDIKSLSFLDSLRGFGVGTKDTLIFTTTGGDTWSVRGMNTGNLPYYDVIFLDTLMGYACGECGVVVKTTDGGVTWERMWVGTNSRLMSISVKDDKVWSCGEWTTLSHSSGSGWEFQLPWSNWLRGVQFLDSLNGWIAGEGGMVLHTTDGGDSWEVKELSESDEFRDIGVRDSLTVFAVGRDKNDQPLMWRTTDVGNSWEKVSIGGPFIRAIEFVDTLYGWTGGIDGDCVRIYRTTDGGNSWNVIANVDSFVTEFHDFDFVDRNRGWFVEAHGYSKETSGTIWVTTDGGVSWDWQQTTFNKPLYGISMWDSLIGCSCGKDVLLWTTNGGVGLGWNKEDTAG